MNSLTQVQASSGDSNQKSGNATDILVGDDPNLIVNMSVWDSVESLFDFAYKSAHRLIVAERRSWFKQPDGAYQVRSLRTRHRHDDAA